MDPNIDLRILMVPPLYSRVSPSVLRPEIGFLSEPPLRTPHR